MRKAGLILGALMVGLVAATHSIQASFLNAPHNEANGLECKSCHEYPFDAWPGYIPDVNNQDDTIRNFICLNCHGGGAAPDKAMHSSLVLGSKYPSWTTQCVDCHDPHFQQQLDYLYSDTSALFLATGTVSSVISTGATTIIQYGGLAVHAGEWSAPASWSAKTASGRGLIFVDDITAPVQTGEIISANGNSIEVSGTISANCTGRTFGIIYGMLVRNRVRTPDGTLAPVKFFKPDGGFTSTSATNGICQVCHTLTAYWKNDAVVAGDHNAGSRCTGCHLAVNGFKPTFPDHETAGYVVPVQPCATCHTGADVIADTHRNQCNHCHSTVPSLKGGLSGGNCAHCHGGSVHDSAVDHDHRAATAACASCHAVSTQEAVDVLHRSDCTTCHGYAGGLLNLDPAGVANAIAAGKGAAGTDIGCGNCHAAPHATAADHDHRLASAACASCHQVGSQAAIDSVHRSDCGTCHGYSGGRLNLDPGLISAAITAGKGGSGADTACEDCHAPPHDTALAHDNRVVSGLILDCTTCHAVASQAAIDTLHNNDCTTCHGYTGGRLNIDPALVSAAITDGKGGLGTPVNCEVCHGVNYGHPLATHSKVTAADGCATCHSRTDIIRDIHASNCVGCHDSARPEVRTAVDTRNGGDCQTCHTGIHTALVDILTVHNVSDNSNCSTCHFPAYPASPHNNVANAAYCENCHASGNDFDTVILVLHKDDCRKCHQSTAPAVVTAISAGKANPGVQATCETCHGVHYGHPSATHGKVLAVAGCVVCHVVDTGIIADIHNNDCLGCHTSTVDEVRTAIDTRAGGSCATCHVAIAADWYNHDVDHGTKGFVSLSADCQGCHAATLSYPAFTDPANDKKHDGCAVCHNGDGSQKNGAAVGGAECTTCHGAYFASHTAIDHSATVALFGGCGPCHAPTAGTTTTVPVDSGDNKLHDACSTCHGANGDLVAGAIPGAGDCSKCHAAAYFDSHGYGDGHLQTALRAADLAGGVTCRNCHGGDVDASGTRLDSWIDIRGLHDVATNGAGACATCHQSGRQEVKDAITAGMGGGQIACLSCHSGRAVDHADHVAMGVLGGLASCNACHDPGSVGTSAFYTATLHGGCVGCHTDPGNDDYSLKAGSAAEGHGRADGGFGNPNTCATCHAAIAADWYSHDVDHQTKGFVSLSADCENCHAVTLSYPAFTDAANDKKHDGCAVCHNGDGSLKNAAAVGGGECTTCHGAYFASHTSIDHSATVAMAANCATCHAGAQGSAATVPVDSGNNKVHDSCAACHAANGNLVAGAVPGTGDCTKCHGAYFASHTSIDHSATVALAANCADCHAATAGDATTVPVSGANNRLHDSCAVCHAADGKLTGRLAVGYNGGTDGGTDGGGNCATCHFNDFAAQPHKVVGHASMVAGLARCVGCHPGTAGDGTGVPISGASSKIHDSCASCHTASGRLIDPATSPLVTAMPKGTGFGGSDGGGNCGVCHTAFIASFYSSHGQPNHMTAGYVTSTTDSSCETCHNDADTVFGSRNHHVNCFLCHHMSTGEMLTGSSGGAVVGGGNCKTCHVGYAGITAAGHDSSAVHDKRAISWSGTALVCSHCHSSDTSVVGRKGSGSLASQANVDALHGRNWDGTAMANNCELCHWYQAGWANPEGLPAAASVSSYIASGKAGTQIACTDCHGYNRIDHGSHPDSAFGWSGTCGNCHSGANIANDVHKAKCVLCHVSPSTGNYARRAGTDGSAVGATSAATCTTCHSTATYPTGGIHHDTARAANNRCTDCHAAVNHAAMVANVSPCSRCHTGTAGTAGGVPVSTAGSMVHDSCRTCHTFNAGKRGILVNFTNQRGVNGSGSLPDGGTIGGSNGGGTCKACHTAASASGYHHNGNRTAVGECEYCHADPRGAWSAVRPGDANSAGTAITGAGTLMPTQLPCVNCHAAFGGGNLTITKYSRATYTSLATDWTRATVHTIPNSASQINNWGICLDCHNNPNNATSPQVNIWHARPDKNGGAGWALGTTRYQRSRCNGNEARYAAGRAYDGSGGSGSAVSSNIGAFNIFRNDYYIPSGKPGSNNCASVRSEYDSKPNSTPNFVRITIPAVVHNGNMANQQVPVFGAKTANQGTALAAADNISVLSALWNGSGLTVTATHSVGACSTLTARYGAVTQTMSGTTTCTATLNGVSYPAGGTTVDVTTSNSSGISVLGYRITDGTAITSASAVNDSMTVSPNGTTNLDVMANDSGTGIYIYSVTQPGIGSVAIAGDNMSINFTGSGVQGATSFTYKLVGTTGWSSTATVTLTVASNQAPTVVNDAYTVTTSTTTGMNVLVNDSDSDGPQSLTVSAVGTPNCGSVVNNGTSVSYTAPATTGTCTFSYTVFDGINSVVGTVNVTVNNPPYADWTETFAGAADATLLSSQSLGVQWSPGSSNVSANCWFTDTNTTGSGNTGLTAGNPAPYLYLEASTSSSPSCTYNIGDQFWLESPDLPANNHTFTLSFDWNYESTQANGRTIRVYYRNGTGGAWTQLGSAIASAPRGTSAAWASSGTINLAGVLNQTGSRVRIHVTADTNNYENDVVFDNIRIDGTP
ncbi:MAG: Ig-like domain-containing protein [Thermodesulfobacteriota bacterium]